MGAKSLQVAVLGAGRMARAVAQILLAKGVQVRVWARSEEGRSALVAEVPVPVTGDVGEAAGPADLVFFAVPAPAIEEVAGRYGPFARGDQVVLHASRGVAEGFRLPHQLIRARTCVRKIAALGGPLHVRELVSGRPLVAVVASRYDEAAALMRRLTEGTPVRVHASRDLVGVEVAGAISNVSALAVGMAEALNLGETAKGVLLTRGLAEGQRLAAALGGNPATLAGLAGVGDLIPRRVSSTERHHEVGAAVALGKPAAEALAGVHGAVEGVITAAEGTIKGAALGLELPLVRAVHGVLAGELKAAEALEMLLQLDIDLGEPNLAAAAD